MPVSSTGRLGAVLLLVAAGSAVAQTDVPQRMMFQGRLVRADGTPETTPQNLQFSLYDQAQGGTPLWTETHQQVQLSNGYYAVELGTSNPLGGVFDGSARWLAVALEGQQAMGPRLPIASSPYALRAGDTALLGGRPASDYATTDHDHPDATTTSPGFMSPSDKSKLSAVPTVWGNGLTTSTSSGDVRVDVQFAGSGSATTAARSNHTHALPELTCTRRSAQGAFDTGITSTCNTGEVVTGGGCEGVPQGSSFTVDQMPVTNGFRCKANGSQAPSTQVTAWAVCCRLQ